MKNDGVVELERMRGLVLVVSTTGLLFLWSPWGCNGHPKPPEAGLVEQSGGGNTGLHNGRPVRSRWRDHGRGKEMAGRRHGVMQSWHWKGWGPMVWRIDRDGENDENSSGIRPLSSRSQRGEFSKSFHRYWVCFFARVRGFGGYDHGSWMDKQWRTLKHWLCENLDCSRKLLLLLLQLSWLNWFD
jgi:hypothetical protein